jgi:MYXO-CTERM domain-containing protein
MFAFTWVGTAIAGSLPRWSDDAFPVSYSVGDLTSTGVDDAAALDAIAAAFATWENVSCPDATFPVAFQFAGRVKDVPWGDPWDGVNAVLFFGKEWPGHDDASPSAVRLDIDEKPNSILEGDIALNDLDFDFAVNGDGHVTLDLQSTMTHEVGRLLGLDVSGVTGATMNPLMAGKPEGASLAQADIDAVCDLYGVSTDTGIPNHSVQGDPCTRSEDCTDGFVCVVDNGDQYCAARCGTDGQCGSGTSCEDPGSGSPVCILLRETTCGVVPPKGSGFLALGLVALAVRRRRHR